jgi:hypothetical protein
MKAGRLMLILAKVNFRTRNNIKYTEGHYIIKKFTIQAVYALSVALQIYWET